MRDIGGVLHVFVHVFCANVAFIRAWRADTAGNLVYRMTEQNFNAAMATAADLVIAEVEEIVPVGAIAPESVHTPGCFVDYLAQARLSLADLGSSATVAGSRHPLDASRAAMAERALHELSPGNMVNLGVGIPTLVADLLSPAGGIILHTENGMLGVGPAPATGGALDYPVNAGKVPVTALPGASYFDSASSCAMIRGGHVDVAIMGALQVDEHANLANWAVCQYVGVICHRNGAPFSTSLSVVAQCGLRFPAPRELGTAHAAKIHLALERVAVHDSAEERESRRAVVCE